MRSRYLDLIAREQARRNVIDRAKVNASLRRTFDALGFIEVETPMLQVMHGGASARPFVTHSNAFDTELYLRIAPELYLKRAVVGGIERVYEINRNFRNEGADSTHSPEFAMLEAYEAYGDYTTMADLTQKLIQDAALAATRLARRHLGRRHRVRPRRRVGPASRCTTRCRRRWGSRSPPRRRSTRLKAARRRRGHRDRPPAARQVRRGALGAPRQGRARAPDVRHGLPARHLARSCARTARSRASSRSGTSTCAASSSPPGYSELVDPVVQRERFVEQAKLAAGGDPEAMRLDEEFLRALEFGMPPSGGMGMGIDRLLMAITGLGIRETILFPLVK